MSKLLESLGLKQPDVKGTQRFLSGLPPVFLCRARCLYKLAVWINLLILCVGTAVKEGQQVSMESGLTQPFFPPDLQRQLRPASGRFGRAQEVSKNYWHATATVSAAGANSAAEHTCLSPGQHLHHISMCLNTSLHLCWHSLHHVSMAPILAVRTLPCRPAGDPCLLVPLLLCIYRS